MKEKHMPEQTVDYQDKLYKYISSLNTSNQVAKRHYSEVAQCHLERNKKNDSSNYCSTCFTTNAYQWRLKLNSRKTVPKVPKQGKCSKRKIDELVLKCVVCHAVKKHLA